MNKRLAILSLVSVMTITLGSCGEGYDYKDGVMLYINGKAYTTNELYDSYGLDSTTGVQGYYKILNNVAIEADIATDASMDNEVANAIDTFKKTAQTNAKNNGTTESEEIENSLSSEGVDTLEELEDKYYLQFKTTKSQSDYTSDANYTSTFIPKYTSTYHPYHVRHILVKFDSDDVSSLYQGTISQSDAEDINNVVTRLASGSESFGSVAMQKSEDGDSSSTGVTGPSVYGDCGIMSTLTSFVSEFKYGIYTYDAYFNNDTTVKSNHDTIINDCFSSDSSNVSSYESVAGSYAYGIPYSAIMQLGSYASKTTDVNGQSVNNASAYYYPRNILFNNYFNNHGLSFIYLDDYDSSMATNAYGETCYTQAEYNTLNSGTRFQTVDGVSNKLASYSESDTSKHTTGVSAVSGSKKILCDENGNPILVTRASSGSGDSGYNGLHFIVIQNDPFAESSDDLNSYYTLTKPSTTTTSSNTGNTYVGFVSTTNRDVYSNRVSQIKSDVDSSDSNLEYTRYEYYMNKATTGDNANGITVSVSSDISNAVNSYIESLRATSAESTTRSYDASWQSYLYQLQLRDTLSTRIVPESGISAFANGSTSYASYESARAGK